MIQITRNFLGVKVDRNLREDPGQEFKMLRVHVVIIIQKLLLSHKVSLAGLCAPFKLSKQLLTDLVELPHVILI